MLCSPRERLAGVREPSGVPGHRSWLSQMTRPPTLGEGSLRTWWFSHKASFWNHLPGLLHPFFPFHSLIKINLGLLARAPISLGLVGQSLRSPQSQSLTQTLPAPRSQGKARRGRGPGGIQGCFLEERTLELGLRVMERRTLETPENSVGKKTQRPSVGPVRSSCRVGEIRLAKLVDAIWKASRAG